MIAFIGMETSGMLRRRFQAAGIECYSCDKLPAEDGGEEMAYRVRGKRRDILGRHLVGDVFDTLDNLWSTDLWPTVGIFHPDCTYLTNSAAWAFNDPDFAKFPGVGYHQKVKPGTLVGAARRAAREEALNDVRRIMALPIRVKIIENPIGAISTAIRPPLQILHPYSFGDDASKATCLWMLGKDNDDLRDMRIPVDKSKRFPPRLVTDARGRTFARWSNQTDSGQNRLSPGAGRWKDRARTYPGIADAVVKRCVEFMRGEAS